MVDLPAPIIPTSTIERPPKAAEISASWVVALTALGKIVSDISSIDGRGMWLFGDHTTRTAISPCNEISNMVVVNRALAEEFNG
jgi:hypothetical protein